jgi:hypothetical protein
MGAKVTLAEKREWLRFVKNNSKNQQEFNDIIQNESIDTYKRRILGADTVNQEEEFWKQFEKARKDAKLAQKLGQLQPSIAASAQECMGQLASFGPT